MSEFDEIENILEGVRTLRSVLPEVLGDRAAAMDAAVVALLQRSNVTPDVHLALLEQIATQKETQDWMAQYLGGAVIEKSFQGLPGRPTAVGAPKYRCPLNDYVWFRRDSAIVVPKCPTHGLLLQES